MASTGGASEVSATLVRTAGCMAPEESKPATIILSFYFNNHEQNVERECNKSLIKQSSCHHYCIVARFYTIVSVMFC